MIIDLYNGNGECIQREVTLDRMFTELQDTDSKASRAYLYGFDGGPVEQVIIAITDEDGIFLRSMDVSKSRPLKRDLDTTKKVTP